MVESQMAETGARQPASKGDEKPVLIWGMTADNATAVFTLANAIFTLALVVVGAATAIVFICQTRLLGRQVEEMKAATSASAKAAKAAEESAKAIPKIERAYVFANVKLVQRIMPIQEGITTAHFVVNFYNYGKTPAIITMLRGYAELAHAVPRAPIEHPGADERLPEGLVIASGKAYQLPLQLRLVPADMNDLISLARIVYCVGMIEYKDFLGDTRETGFCWEYRHRTDQAGSLVFCRNSELNYRK
jgi:hypothetical protein